MDKTPATESETLPTRQAKVCCQFCDTVMIEKSVSGTHLDGREDEASWFECPKCGNATDAQ